MCPENPVCKIGTSNFITSDYKGMGYCSKDENGCPIENKYSNMDVTQPKKWNNDYKGYGGSFGAKTIIVQGNFIKWNSDATSYNEMATLPVTAICGTTLESYTMKFYNFKWNSSTNSQDGLATVKCTQKGKKKFNCMDNEYCSEVNCYDPKTLCEKRYSKINLKANAPHCDISCMSNGRCQPGKLTNTVDAQLIKKDVMAKLHSNRRLFGRHLNEVTHKQYQCWCYSDGLKHDTCPHIGTNGEIKPKY